MTEQAKQKRNVFTAFILDRKIPQGVLSVLCYICFCFANFVDSRNSIATSVYMYSAQPAVRILLGNDIVAFLFGGLLPFLVVSLISKIPLRKMAFFGVDFHVSRYCFEFFISCASLSLGFISIIAVFVPVALKLFSTVVSFLVYSLFVFLYLVFMSRNVLEKPQISKFVFNAVSTFLILYMVVVAIELAAMVL